MAERGLFAGDSSAEAALTTETRGPYGYMGIAALSVRFRLLCVEWPCGRTSGASSGTVGRPCSVAALRHGRASTNDRKQIQIAGATATKEEERRHGSAPREATCFRVRES